MTHAIHIVKSDGWVSEGVSGTLLSLCKVLAHSRSKQGLVREMRAHIQSRLEIRSGVAQPRRGDLYEILSQTLNMDGRSVDGRTAGTPAGSGPTSTSTRGRQWQLDLRRAVDSCVYSDGKYVVYIPSAAAGSADREKIVDSILSPLVKLMVSRSWGQVALNRWGSTIAALKRVVIGMLFNNILPESLVGLGAQAHITEQQLQDRLRKLLSSAAAEESAGKDTAHAIEHSKRVLRLSTYFNTPGRSWQCGIVLIACSIVDDLH